MRVLIRRPDMHTIVLEAAALESVEELKRKMPVREPREFDYFALFFSGDELEDDRSLYYYDIRDGSILHLVSRARTPFFAHADVPPVQRKRVFRSAFELCADYVAVNGGDDRGWICSQFPQTCRDCSIISDDSEGESASTATPRPGRDPGANCVTCMACLTPVNHVLRQRPPPDWSPAP